VFFPSKIGLNHRGTLGRPKVLKLNNGSAGCFRNQVFRWNCRKLKYIACRVRQCLLASARSF